MPQLAIKSSQLGEFHSKQKKSVCELLHYGPLYMAAHMIKYIISLLYYSVPLQGRSKHLKTGSDVNRVKLHPLIN